MAYIDPVTGAYVANSLDALPPGYNQPKAGNEANVSQMRAQLNSDEALRQQQLNSQAKSNYLSDPSGLAKFAMERMPGASFVQGLMPSILGMPQFLASLAYGAGNQAVNPQTANFDADTTKAMRAMQYTPPTQAGKDIANKIGEIGERVGPLPEVWNSRVRFTPDDLRVLAKTGIEDVRNFPSDYANARAGITREYPTMGSRAAGATETAGNVAKPFVEPIYNQVMETGGFNVPGMPNEFNVPVASYAVKSGGGNNPTNLGSTLPLKEQGALGEYLSSVQYDNPIAVFRNQLEKHFPRGIDNRQLLRDFEDYQEKRIGLALEPNSPERYLSNEELNKKIADEFAELYNNKQIGAADINPDFDKKLYTASRIEQVLPPYNSWIMGQHKKYITNQMGTGLATDPALRAVNESGMPPHEIFGQDMPRDYEIESMASRAEQRRKDFSNSDAPENSSIGKITATTPEGIAYENSLDASLYPKGPYAFRDKNPALTGRNTEFPAIAKLDSNALITDFLTKPEERAGFAEIRKKVFQNLLSNTLDPNDLPKTTMDAVIRQMIKDKSAEFKEQQLSKKGAADWIPKRAAALPTDMAFDDGSKMTIITPEMANADEAMTARDLGQITIDLNQCVGAGCHATQDYPGHGPYLVPHTGKPPRGKVEYDKYNYLKRLKNGEIEIASLKDPEGVSQATLELKLPSLSDYQKDRLTNEWLKSNAPDYRDEYNTNIENFGEIAAIKNAIQLYPELKNVIYGGKKSVQQIKGKDNGDIKEEYVPQVVQWLNANADQLTDVRELGNLPGVHDLTRSYDAVGKMMDKHQHWYSPTVEEFFQTMENKNALPRFFTTDDFALKATEHGVDLSAEPIRTEGEQPKYPEGATNYQKDLIDYFQPGAIRKSYGGYDRIISFDPRTNTVIATEVKRDENGNWIDHPTYGGPRSHNTMPSAMEFQKDMGRPMRNMQALDNENELANAVQGMEPENAGEFNRPSPQRITSLQQAMDRFFNNEPINITVDEAGDHRILMGSPRPEAQLPDQYHKDIVDALLNQDQHAGTIRYIIDTLQGPGYFPAITELTDPQLENILNIVISWTERYPLAE